MLIPLKINTFKINAFKYYDTYNDNDYCTYLDSKKLVAIDLTVMLFKRAFNKLYVVFCFILQFTWLLI